MVEAKRLSRAKPASLYAMATLDVYVRKGLLVRWGKYFALSLRYACINTIVVVDLLASWKAMLLGLTVYLTLHSIAGFLL